MKHKDNKKMYVIIFAIIVSLSMIGSIFGIILDNYQTNKIKYGKYSFTVTNAGTYNVKINGKMTEFMYFPTDLERIPFDAGIKDKLLNSQAFVLLFDPVESNDSLEFIDLMRYELPNQISKQVVFGITRQSDKYIMPVLSCDNATATVPFVIITDSSNTSIVFDPLNNNCIIMNARLKDVLAAQDRLVYTLNGVMQ